ncbi:hypothetical protein N7468_003461 [Penicillium chermesinum]|uniref:Uncharacterized protein n=1 Tax=Penicillium chermesinum TaxID=63820 RepID=A0A9W9P9A5_9EURO|nr:uncharacterized protein N7468_003461 [Penicillium chermesinum]KAJ5238842.1 hypothetical protein N7468_003461 [Penicillium chermesinum]
MTVCYCFDSMKNTDQPKDVPRCHLSFFAVLLAWYPVKPHSPRLLKGYYSSSCNSLASKQSLPSDRGHRNQRTQPGRQLPINDFPPTPAAHPRSILKTSIVRSRTFSLGRHRPLRYQHSRRGRVCQVGGVHYSYDSYNETAYTLHLNNIAHSPEAATVARTPEAIMLNGLDMLPKIAACGPDTQ